MNNQINLRLRIEKGIKFFRQMESKEDTGLFTLYWKSFLDLVEEYIAEPVEETIESAKKIFKGDVKEE